MKLILNNFQFQSKLLNVNNLFLQALFNKNPTLSKSVKEFQFVFIYQKDCNVVKGGEQFHGTQVRKQFITEYTLKIYQSHLNNLRSDIDFMHLSYFAYLIDHVKNFRFFYSELIQLSRNKSIYKSLIYKQAINYLFYYASCQQQKEESANKKLNSLAKKSKLEESFQTCLYDIITFDEQYHQALQLLRSGLILKYNLVKILGNNFVDLNQLYESASTLIQSKNKLYLHLLQLQNKNECNQELQNICNIFEQTLQFSEKQNIFKKKVNKYNVINKLPLRSADSCVIFVSLMNNFGNVIRVSKNFQEVITSYSNQEVTNSNLNIIVPNQIYELHQQQLRYYLSQKQNITQIKNFPLQIGSSKEGWAIPLNIKTQYHQIGEQEIGVSAWIRKIEDNSRLFLSLQIDEKQKQCLPVVMSQVLFENIFKDLYTQKQIPSINMNLFAPALYGMIHNSENFSERETFFIKPTSKAELTNNSLDFKQNPSYFNEIFKNNDIFLVQFYTYRSQSQFINLAQLELIQITRIEDKAQKYEALKSLSSQLTIFCNYKQPKQFDIQNNLSYVSEETFSSHQAQIIQSNQNMINQNLKLKKKNQIFFTYNQNHSTTNLDLNQLQYEEIQIQNEREEISFDQNNFTSRYLLNQTSTLNDLDNLQLYQGMSSTQIELQKGRSSQNQNSLILTNSVLKNKQQNNDKNLEQLINHHIFTKQISNEQYSPDNIKSQKQQTKDYSILNSTTNKMNSLFKNHSFKNQHIQAKNNEYESSVSSMKTTNSKTKQKIF